jgi:hypothetical protein
MKSIKCTWNQLNVPCLIEDVYVTVVSRTGLWAAWWLQV